MVPVRGWFHTRRRVVSAEGVVETDDVGVELDRLDAQAQDVHASSHHPRVIRRVQHGVSGGEGRVLEDERDASHPQDPVRR